MGLPGFFAWLLKHHRSKILLKNLNERVDHVDHFYIDANCLFHPECAKIKDYFPNVGANELEDKMCKRIKNYLEYLYKYVDATKTVGTMVDGVCPLAKMSQQRKRRYKSIEDTEVRNNLKKKYGKIVNDKWSNIVITPGTEFMEKLHQELMDLFTKISNKKTKTSPKYVYSSYQTAGEGEHSILQHIKSNANLNDVVVIYGLDADLIFLAMTSGIENIYLLRESLHFGIKEEDNELYDPIEDVSQELMYISIKEIKNAFNNQILYLANRSKKEFPFNENTNFSNDLVIICFLLGNDFLPHFPSINIYKGGLDSIISSYIETITDSKMLLTTIENGKIKLNSIVFTMLCEKMGNCEETFFRNGIPYFNSILEKKRCMGTDEYSKELWKLENMKIFKIDDPVMLGTGNTDEWKFRYYEHYFGVVENQREFIDKLIKLYLEGIMWVSRYYFESCPAWKWHYPYDHGPFISDINEYLTRTNFDINTIEFELGRPVSPMIQLLTVLPPNTSNIVASSYRDLMTNPESPIIYMYPKKTQLDMLGKDHYWQCIPKLPIMDIEKIEETVVNKKLTKNEEKRNKERDIYVFKKI